MAVPSLAHRLAFEEAIRDGLNSYRDPDGLWRGVPSSAYLDRGLCPPCMDEALARRRIAARFARQPSLEVTLEALKGKRDARDGDLKRTNDVEAFRPSASKFNSKHAIIFGKPDAVGIEIVRLRRGLVMAAHAQIALVRLAQAACRKFLRRLIRTLFHSSISVGGLDNPSEDRSPARLQDPAGEHPQPV